MLLGIALGAALLGPAPARAEEPSPPPVIRSVRYGRFRPRGAARAYWALRIRARDPDGQIVAFGVNSGHADGGCGLQVDENGKWQTLYLPMRLRRGRHRLRVQVESSSCDERRLAQQATKRVAVRAR